MSSPINLIVISLISNRLSSLASHSTTQTTRYKVSELKLSASSCYCRNPLTDHRHSTNTDRSQASTIIPQILPNFVLQRSLYEARERPAKTYSWQVFMISNILVELPWNTLMAILIYVAWYFPIGLWRNAIPTDAVAERAGMMLLFLWVYMMLASTCGHMVQAAVEVVDLGANYVNLLFMISLIFCGYDFSTSFPN